VNEEKKAFVVFGSIAMLFLIAAFIGFSILDRADFSSFKEKRAEDAPIEKKREPVVIKTPIDVVDKPTENVEPDYKPNTQSLVKPKPKGNPGIGWQQMIIQRLLFRKNAKARLHFSSWLEKMAGQNPAL
jgi:hypothetical protein